MNAAALAVADGSLLNFPTVTLPKGKTLYHGARSKNKIVSLKPNAMFTSNLFYAVDYAFKRDLDKYHDDGSTSYHHDLQRSLFCCTLNRDVKVVEITGVNWPVLCSDLKKADHSMPDYDGWLQNNLTSYLSMRYGSQVDGAILLSGSKGAYDEFIFVNASSIFSVHRKID